MATKSKTARATKTKRSRMSNDAGITQIRLVEVEVHPDQPRQAFDGIASLADSLADDGQLQNIVVRKLGSKRYQLLAGERRFRAAKEAGWKTIAAVVRNVDDAEAAKILIDENLQRKQLNPIERARALALLTRPADEGGVGLTHRDAGSRYAKSATWVSDQLSLLKLPEEWQSKIIAGQLSVSVAFKSAAYCDSPDVLKAILDDVHRCPWDWKDVTSIRKNIEYIVNQAMAEDTTEQAPPDINGEPVRRPKRKPSKPAVGPQKNPPTAKPWKPQPECQKPLTERGARHLLFNYSHNKVALSIIRDKADELLHKLEEASLFANEASSRTDLKD